MYTRICIYPIMKKPTCPQILNKPSGCIHVNHDLSGRAQRVYNCLLAYIQDDLADIEGMPIFQVPTEIVREHLHTRADDRIKEHLRELRRTDVEFNNIGKGGAKWGCYGFINDPEMVGGYIRFSIAPTLRQLMVDSTMFAKINMLIERKFKKTKHAQPLYELGLDYRDFKDPMTGKRVTPWMELDEFRKYMGIKTTEYTTFKMLNQKVIQKGLKEIKAESDIILKLDKETEKRQVKRIRFFIEDNKANMSAEERIRRLQATLPIEGTAGVEIAHYAEILNRIYQIHIPRAKNIARGYVGYKEDFARICLMVDQKKIQGECKGVFGAWAAGIFDAEAPMLKLTKDKKNE